MCFPWNLDVKPDDFTTISLRMQYLFSCHSIAVLKWLTPCDYRKYISHVTRLLNILNRKVDSAQCSSPSYSSFWKLRRWYKYDPVLHKENDDDFYEFSVINMELVQCRCRDHPGLGKFVRGSELKIDWKISQCLLLTFWYLYYHTFNCCYAQQWSQTYLYFH